jgi:Plants and Prokaryotes Conserved (PCC) domain
VLSAIGDVAVDEDGRASLHVHVVLGLSDGTTRGGHFLSGIVWPTLEVVLTEAPATLRRRKRPELGIALVDPPAQAEQSRAGFDLAQACAADSHWVRVLRCRSSGTSAPEDVERVGCALHHDLGLVVVVAADFTGGDTSFCSIYAARRLRVRAAFFAERDRAAAGRFAAAWPPSRPPLREGE